MEEEQKQLVDFVTEDGSAYKTRLTAKTGRRKPFKRNNPRQIEASLPGLVSKLHVKEGDCVSIGTPLLVLESMKMGNLIKSATEGKIKRIFAEEGKHISKGDVMMEME